MNENAIHIQFDDVVVRDCSSAIMVPERALHEAGYIVTMTAHAHAHSKHEFHAMAQMAFFQLQDDELEIVTVKTTITVALHQEVETVEAGVVMYRDFSGGFHVLAHEGQKIKKLLEAANRYCTRWVRLDI